VYELYENGEYHLVETIDNTSPEEERHADPKKLKGVTGLLSGCEAVVSGVLSPNFMRMRDTKPIQPVVSKKETVAETLAALAESFEDLFRLVSARRQGERPEVILQVE